MINLLKVTLFTLLLGSNWNLASGSENDAICNGERITPSNYPFKYKKTKRKLKKLEGKTFVERFNQLVGDDSEICAWNKFLFVDFLIYFDRFHDYKLDKSSNIITTLELRDDLYSNWAKINKTAEYSEYSNEDLSQVSFEEFNKRKSENFAFITEPMKLLNRRPRSGKAKQFVYDLLQARSPFNGIFGSRAIELLRQPSTKSELECVMNSADFNFSSNLKSCFNSKTRMIEVLGVLASQRMYLIRDYSSFVKQTSTESEYDLFYTNARLSSSLYFKLETMAHKMGVTAVYPISNEGLQSPKPYHFYSVAFISNEMKNAGFSDEQIQKQANAYAVKYKKNIKLVGILYNTLSGIPLKNGSVGDANQILKEQKLGIKYILENL